MSDNQEILVEPHDDTVTVILNRPDKRNALNARLQRDLVDILQELNAQPQVRSILLTGIGSCFCAGADIEELQGMSGDAIAALEKGRETEKLLLVGRRLRKPLVAAVNGPALGIGCGLLTICHVVVASEKASFGLPEIKLGLFPLALVAAVASWTNWRLALELGLTGRPVDAVTALQAGLVNKVVPLEDLLPTAERVARELARLDPGGMHAALEAFWDVRSMSLEQALRYVTSWQVSSYLNPEFQAGVKAFLEK